MAILIMAGRLLARFGCHAPFFNTLERSGNQGGGAQASNRNKAVVRRLVDEVLNGGHLAVIDEPYAPEAADAAKAWIAPFQAAFPDLRMAIIDLIADGETVVGRFTCSATHLGVWLGHIPTGRRFADVDEVGIYRFRNGRILERWGLEDNLRRLEQLGLRGEHDPEPAG